LKTKKAEQGRLENGMSYRLSEEQQEMQKVVARIAREKVAPLAAEIEKNGVPREILQLLIDQGIFGLPYPEKYGGGGGDILTFCLVVEELAKYCSNTSMFILNQKLGAMPIMIAGTEEQKSRYLPGIVAGKEVCSFALTEPDAGSDVASMRTTAVLENHQYVINGYKQFISLSDIATRLSLFAKTDKEKGHRGISAFIVEKPSPGLEVGKHEDKMGMRGISNCALIFDQLRVPEGNRLGNAGEGFKIAMKTLDATRAVLAALAVGLAQGALNVAAAYCQERVQFGKPLAQFQGLRFMVADMAMAIEAARQLTYRSAAVVDHGEGGAARLGAMAKCLATDTAMKVTTDAVQLMGGYGYMREYPLERKMRDAKLLQIVEGTNQIQRIVIAGEILGA